METVRLKNGTEEAKILVAIMMKVLKQVAKEKPFALYELAMRCRNPSSYGIGLVNRLYLEDLRLIDLDGEVHESDRNIILSAVEGEGINMKLVSPIAKEE